MSTQISQGGNQSLKAAGIHGSQCFIGLGWSLVQNGTSCEIDASAFVLGENGLVSSDGGFVFYNQPCDDLAGCLTLRLSDAEARKRFPGQAGGLFPAVYNESELRLEELEVCRLAETFPQHLEIVTLPNGGRPSTWCG
ncbi:MAG: TerD family protein [Verrucomicrobiota bacterium]